MAEAAYLAAKRNREQAIADVDRLEDALAREKMGSSDTGWLGQIREHRPDPNKIAVLSEKLAAAHAARDAADGATQRALQKLNRTAA